MKNADNQFNYFGGYRARQRKRLGGRDLLTSLQEDVGTEDVLTIFRLYRLKQRHADDYGAYRESGFVGCRRAVLEKTIVGLLNS